ncbi:hypothetical protein FHP25_17160 [Vineibacter terrae]|uniref:Uncharacterized protein n=1 Tax=Vineibacter terrae TaxID=2586908 RepID=A0A5C8PL96_9HYPH|nr:hypothetical protein [Vineibacter terrae]TXL74490.1 hypothetical protein FHP25_17160 [Vineibacter terrae]
MMTKAFLVRRGFEARNGQVRYGPGVKLFVEDDEEIEVYMLRLGKPCRARQYPYASLDMAAPPTGLRPAALQD